MTFQGSSDHRHSCSCCHTQALKATDPALAVASLPVHPVVSFLPLSKADSSAQHGCHRLCCTARYSISHNADQPCLSCPGKDTLDLANCREQRGGWIASIATRG
eukprot:1155248-Pelagomonas_calceolata.AAC.2